MTNVIDTYKDMIVGYASATIAQVKNHLAKTIPVRVAVEDGLHAGFSQICEVQTINIGDALSDTIMLLDPGVCGETVVLRNLPSVVSPVVIVETSREDVFIDGKRVLNTAPKRLPFRLKIADVTLLLSDGQPTQTNWHANGLKLAASLALIAFAAERYLAWKEVIPVQMMQAEAHENSANDQAFDLAVTQLNTAGFGEFLTISKQDDGTLSVAGILPPVQAKSWGTVRQKIDSVTGGIPIHSTVKANASLPDLPPFAAIRVDGNPQIILAGGARWAVGSAIGEGWTITQIDRTHMLVERGTEHIEVAF